MNKRKVLTSSATCYYKGPAQISKDFKLPGIEFVEKMQKDNIIGHFIVNSSGYEFDEGNENIARSKTRQETEEKIQGIKNILNLWIDSGYFEIREQKNGFTVQDLNTEEKFVESEHEFSFEILTQPYNINSLPKPELFHNILALSNEQKNNGYDTFRIMMEFYNSGKALKESYHKTSFLMFYKVIETFWVGWMNKGMNKADELWKMLKLSDFFTEDDVNNYIIDLAKLEKKFYEEVTKNKDKRLLILVAIKAARGKCLTAHGKLKDSVTDRKYYPPINETEKIAKRAILYYIDEMKKRINIDLRS